MIRPPLSTRNLNIIFFLLKEICILIFQVPSQRGQTAQTGTSVPQVTIVHQVPPKKSNATLERSLLLSDTGFAVRVRLALPVRISEQSYHCLARLVTIVRAEHHPLQEKLVRLVFITQILTNHRKQIVCHVLLENIVARKD